MVARASAFGGHLWRRAAREPLRPAVVTRPCLADILRGVAGQAGESAADKGLDLILDLEPLADLQVEGDLAAIAQIVGDLVRRAIDTTHAGYVAIAARGDGRGAWRIEVQDTGAGPSDETCDLRRRVNALGWQIQTTGAAGEGSTHTLRLTLPFQPATRVVSVAGPVTPRVLVADADPDAQRLIRMLLASRNADVVSVSSAGEACEVASRQGFDLVLLAPDMPDAPCAATVTDMRALECVSGRSPAAIVILCADDGVDLAALGADGRLAKPIELDALFRLLDRAVERQRVHDAA